MEIHPFIYRERKVPDSVCLINLSKLTKDVISGLGLYFENDNSSKRVPSSVRFQVVVLVVKNGSVNKLGRKENLWFCTVIVEIPKVSPRFVSLVTSVDIVKRFNFIERQIVF